MTDSSAIDLSRIWETRLEIESSSYSAERVLQVFLLDGELHLQRDVDRHA